MNSYDLKRLTDKDLEVLAADLLGAHLSQRIERFKPGKDGGVDGRFFSTPSGEVILQVKHWEDSGFAKLLKHLESSEKPKINRLNPTRYLLVTSVPLSRNNKQQISDALSPHIKTPADIFGNEDIQELLGKHPEIEHQHFKLWLGSAENLRTVFNASIIGRSAFKITEVVDFLPKYVVTAAHD